VVRASTTDSRRGKGSQPPDGYSLALKLLAVRPHSTVELRHKLRQRGCSAGETEEALQRATARGYLDDEAFARSLVARRAAARGAALIGAELASRGVPQALVRLALEGLSREDQVASARQLASRMGAPDARQTAARLQRRGFARDVVSEALDGTLNLELEEG
jgi:regulatory protein